jgi:putative protease
VNHQELVDGTFSSHRGLEVGKVLEIKKKSILIFSKVELRAGMGLLFVSSQEVGSKIFSVSKVGKNFEVELLQKDLILTKGAKVFLNSNEGLSKDLRRGWQTREGQKRIALKFSVQGSLGNVLHVQATDPDGNIVAVSSSSELISASGRPINRSFLSNELSALGSTIYRAEEFIFQLGENLFLHQREIKEIRRRIVERMNELRIQRRISPIRELELRPMPITKSQPGINLLLRNLEQVEGLVEYFPRIEKYRSFIKTVILDFEFGKDYAKSVEALKALGIRTGIATTRILKPSEYYNLNTIIRIRPDVILVRNLGAIQYLKEKCSIPLIGDFSLNVTNSSSLEYLVIKGLETINVSYDLNQEQLLSLTEFADPSRMEVTVHQYMPEFHMEHCVFAAFLSKGTSFKDCGKPCEKHEVKLKDPYGNFHFLKADHECRNTFFKATPQSAAFLISLLLEKGVGTFRVEALSEGRADLNHKIEVYLKFLSGELNQNEAFENLRIVESYGLTPGQLEKPDTYRDRKKY